MEDDFDGDKDVVETILFEQLVIPLIALGAAQIALPLVPASSHPGAQYVEELFLRPHDREFQEVFRMPPRTFMALEAWVGANTALAGSRHVDITEKLAIFLHAIGNGSSLQERFQHSGETIRRIFNEVLRSMLHLALAYVNLPSADGPVGGKIRGNPDFYPYFQDCLGALDGILIDAHVAGENSEAWRDRKGGLTQNVLAAVDFDMDFLYVLAGWKGSALDIRVLHNAMNDQGFSIPPGKYYLGDAGYFNTGVTLCPYPGVPYHLKAQKQAAQRPANAKELFNLRHSRLRNVVERTFGALKKRFPILQHAPPYPMATQVHLIYAMTGLSNFIRRQHHHHRTTEEEERDMFDDDYIDDDDKSNALPFPRSSSATMNAKRDAMAESMWLNYQASLQ